MRCAVVQTETGGETDPGFEPILLYQGTYAVFDAIRDLGHRHTGPYGLACMVANKTVHFGTTADILIR
jgi:hypothetical protein